jgi:hypothetical protein
MRLIVDGRRCFEQTETSAACADRAISITRIAAEGIGERRFHSMTSLPINLEGAANLATGIATAGN